MRHAFSCAPWKPKACCAAPICWKKSAITPLMRWASPREDIRFTGLLVLYNNMLQSLYKSQILTLGAVFVGIMLMFLVLFRSIKISVIAILPNFLAAGIVLGGMGWRAYHWI